MFKSFPAPTIILDPTFIAFSKSSHPYVYSRPLFYLEYLKILKISFRKKDFPSEKKGFKTIKKVRIRKKGFALSKSEEKKDLHLKRFSAFFNIS